MALDVSVLESGPRFKLSLQKLERQALMVVLTFLHAFSKPHG
jgi:hypothetical protein